MRGWRQGVGPGRAAALGLCLALLAACPEDDRDAGDPPGARHRTVTIVRGAGATFPSPIYSRWALTYFEKTGVKLEYTASGSRAGIEAVKDGAADFGASDIPLTPQQQESDGLTQFPIVVGGAVPVVNLPGVGPGQLRLTPDLLAGIYLGQITRWSDPAIHAVNPELALPDREIIPVYRADSSGTSWLLLDFLRRASPRWRRAGEGRQAAMQSVGVGARCNAQMTRFVRRFKHTIGYVVYTYATEADLAWARVRNRAGRYVAPGQAAFSAAVDRGTWRATGGRLSVALNNMPGAESWPITGASYVLLRREQQDAGRARKLLGLFHWALTQGHAQAEALGYAPVPESFVERIAGSWRSQLRAGDAPVWSGSTGRGSPSPKEAADADAVRPGQGPGEQGRRVP